MAITPTRAPNIEARINLVAKLKILQPCFLRTIHKEIFEDELAFASLKRLSANAARDRAI